MLYRNHVGKGQISTYKRGVCLNNSISPFCILVYLSLGSRLLSELGSAIDASSLQVFFFSQKVYFFTNALIYNVAVTGRKRTLAHFN